MSHDIVDNSRLRTALGTEWLVVAAWVEGELAEQGAVLGQDADVLVGDQQGDRLVFVGAADADVVEAAEVPNGDPAGLVDPVLA